MCVLVIHDKQDSNALRVYLNIAFAELSKYLEWNEK